MFITNNLFSQSISTGSYAESVLRMDEILGKIEISNSFTQHPLYTQFIVDSSLGNLIYRRNLLNGHKFLGFIPNLNILPYNSLLEYNSNLPFGYNNSSLYPNVGFQSRQTLGFYLNLGMLNFQFKPEIVNAQNKFFNTFSDIQNNSIDLNLEKAFFYQINGIDAPERFGTKPENYFGFGQSKISLIYHKIEVGVSTENLWWGPGIQNSIILSNSAPGFLHWTFNTVNPIKTKLGSFEWQLIGGKLEQSGYLSYNPERLNNALGLYHDKPSVNRYISAFTINWHPKWIDGFYFGISGFDYLNIDTAFNKRSIIGKLIPVFVGSNQNANASQYGDGQDFAYAFNLRQIFKEQHTEVYFEFARNDRASSFTDLLLEIDHSTGYTVGAAKYFNFNKNENLRIGFELTRLQIPETWLLRAEPTWYSHPYGPPRDGYTNLGRLVGAGIGSGSNSLIFDIAYFYKINSFGLKFERLLHNNDMFFYAYANTISNFDSEWLDVSSTFYTNIKLKKMLISAEFAPVFSYNYEYQNSINIHNNHARINLTYFFD